MIKILKITCFLKKSLTGFDFQKNFVFFIFLYIQFFFMGELKDLKKSLKS